MSFRVGSGRRRGTSLLEIGFCVLLVAIAIIPLLRSQVATTAATRCTREEAIASSLLAMCIERYKDESPRWLATTDLNEHAKRDLLLSPHESLPSSTTSTAPLPAPAEATRAFFASTSSMFRRELSFEILGTTDEGIVTHGLLKARIAWTHRQDGMNRDRAVDAQVLIHERHPRGQI